MMWIRIRIMGDLLNPDPRKLFSQATYVNLKAASDNRYFLNLLL